MPSIRKAAALLGLDRDISAARDLGLEPGLSFREVLLFIEQNGVARAGNALVTQEHLAEASRAAIDIQRQVGDGPGQITLAEQDYRIVMPGLDSGGVKHHFQGIGVLRDAEVDGVRYRRAVLSVNYGPGLMLAAGRLDHPGDGLTSWDHERAVHFLDQTRFLDIINVPEFGNHPHPGGLQTQGDTIAIAMEPKGKENLTASVYFLRVDGLNPRFLGSLVLGTGGAPAGLVVESAAAAGFIRLRDGRWLLAVSGASHGTGGIWFYLNTTDDLAHVAGWRFLDFWTPNRLPGGLCDINDGAHGTHCYVGAGGGVALVANHDGEIYLLAMTGTQSEGWMGLRGSLDTEDEYAQMYRVDADLDAAPSPVALIPIWSAKHKLGKAAKNYYSMRWAGAAQTTADGRLVLLNTERSNRAKGSNDKAEGMLRISSTLIVPVPGSRPGD